MHAGYMTGKATSRMLKIEVNIPLIFAFLSGSLGAYRLLTPRFRDMTIVVKLDEEGLATKGEEIYSKIRDEVEEKFKGKIMAVEVGSEDYFIGSTVTEAVEKARAKHVDKVFYIKRFGYKALYSFR